MAVEQEILLVDTTGQIVAAHVVDFDRHAAHVLLAIGDRRRVGEADPGVVASRLLKQSDLELVREAGNDGEFGFDAAGCACLVEPAHRAGWMTSGARRFEERDEVRGDGGFVRRDIFAREIVRTRHVGPWDADGASYTCAVRLRGDLSVLWRGGRDLPRTRDPWFADSRLRGVLQPLERLCLAGGRRRRTI